MLYIILLLTCKGLRSLMDHNHLIISQPRHSDVMHLTRVVHIHRFLGQKEMEDFNISQKCHENPDRTAPILHFNPTYDEQWHNGPANYPVEPFPVSEVRWGCSSRDRHQSCCYLGPKLQEAKSTCGDWMISRLLFWLQVVGVDCLLVVVGCWLSVGPWPLVVCWLWFFVVVVVVGCHYHPHH